MDQEATATVTVTIEGGMVQSPMSSRRSGQSKRSRSGPTVVPTNEP